MSGKNEFKYQASDKVFYNNVQIQDRDKNELSLSQHKYELNALSKINKIPEEKYILDPDLNKIRANYRVDAFGSYSVKEFGAGFIFNHKVVNSSSHAEVLLSNGKKHKFYRQMYLSNRSRGVNSGVFSMGHVLLAQREKTGIVLEVDQEKTQDSTIVIRTESHFRKKIEKEF